MAIEGPLRELGIHDVFQLLDLSRKTGILRVVSSLRDNEGSVWFDAGHVVAASIRTNPHPIGTLLVRAGKVAEADVERARAMQVAGDARRLGELLVEAGVVAQRDLDKQVRLQVEAVVFELMSWEEGFFSFSEDTVLAPHADALARVSTESMLMEGARRLDEWTRIAHRVPHVGVVPSLVPGDTADASRLDLLPSEWEVLASVDGTLDLRTIAELLGRSEFEVAKVAYGLVSTGVIALREPPENRHSERSEEPLASGATDHRGADVAVQNPLLRARGAALQGRFDDAIDAWRRFLIDTPDDVRAPRVRELVASASRLQELLAVTTDA